MLFRGLSREQGTRTGDPPLEAIPHILRYPSALCQHLPHPQQQQLHESSVRVLPEVVALSLGRHRFKGVLGDMELLQCR